MSLKSELGFAWSLLLAALLVSVAFPLAPLPAAVQEAQPAQPASTIPDWFLADIAAMTRDGGRWIADNANPDEPYRQWGLEWRASPDGKSMSGRLFGMRDGADEVDLWHFRQFWHPGERRAYVMQWGGDGMYGVGEITRTGDGSGMLEQTFWLADGRTFSVGHMFRTQGDERETEQYDILPGQSAWRLNHRLTWRRQARD